MPFALNFLMVKGFSSTACVGIDGGSVCGVGRVGGELQELHAQSLIIDTPLRFEYQNTSNVPNQNKDCTNSSPHDL